MVDSPTNNFCTINPLIRPYGTNTFSEGNLKIVTSSAYNAVVATQPILSTGKFYWEILIDDDGGATWVGISPDGPNYNTLIQSSSDNPQNGDGIFYYEDGDTYIDSSWSGGYGASYTDGDIIGVAINMDDSEVTFYKNNSSQGAVSFSGNSLATATQVIVVGVHYGGTANYNFGSDSSFAAAKTAQGNQDSNEIGDFYYEPPTDFLALCTDNLSDPEIKLPGDNFNTILWSGAQSGDSAPNRSLTGVGFQPDLVWSKTRSDANSHQLWDALRDLDDALASNNTNAEGNDKASGYLASLDSDGFTTTAGTSGVINVDESGRTYVAWNWLGANGTVTNTDGTLTNTVTVSANPTAGFSIVKWSGTSSASTIGHGLTEAPALIIVKNTNTVLNWFCGAGDFLANGWSDWMHLNKTDEQGNNSANAWNSTAPTASVFSVDSHYSTNATGDDYIAYCFHSVEGYSKVGAFTGNDHNDGTFLYLGFRPAFAMFKSYTNAAGWGIEDNKINPYNQQDNYLQADTNDDESTNGHLDFLSNGIKLRNTNSRFNAYSYIYLAFAESPFKYANARE